MEPKREDSIFIKKDGFSSLLLSIEHPSSLIFFSSTCDQKRTFDKAFDINYRLLARDHNAEEVDLSFVRCQYPPAINANRELQQELLNTKVVYMAEAISLVAAFFWDLNFLLCPRHILNLGKKLGFKTKSLKIDLVKVRIEEIWANKTIAELDVFFTNNLDWW